MKVVVRTGMPEHNVEIGMGDNYAEALDSLEMTPMQSVGWDSGVRGALEWAEGAGWFDGGDVSELEDDDGPDDSDDDEDEDDGGEDD
jgi:hypothetical protein